MFLAALTAASMLARCYSGKGRDCFPFRTTHPATRRQPQQSHFGAALKYDVVANCMNTRNRSLGGRECEADSNT